MRTFTKQADDSAVRGPAQEEWYVTGLGVGRVVVAGGLPLRLDLPDPAVPAAPGRPSSRWPGLLERYFAGERVDFDLNVDAYVDTQGFTDFERDVYRALSRVPYGTAVSYRELAAAAGRPNAYRAVGSAMARNLLPVILPCHRVVLNDGRLGQYGDDPVWKARLLTLEGVSVTGGRLA
jgi:methylated-DNA-[protein]-cysteine S-methyltransferase